MNAPNSPVEKIIDYEVFKTLPNQIKADVYRILLIDGSLSSKQVIELLGMENVNNVENVLGAKFNSLMTDEVERVETAVAIALARAKMAGFERLNIPLCTFEQLKKLSIEVQKEIIECLYVQGQLTAALIDQLIIGRGYSLAGYIYKLGILKEHADGNTISVDEALDAVLAILKKHNVEYIEEPVESI